jgi:hypothetical protein
MDAVRRQPGYEWDRSHEVRAAVVPIRVVLAGLTHLPQPLRAELELDLARDTGCTVTSVDDHLEMPPAAGEAQTDAGGVPTRRPAPKVARAAIRGWD